MVIIIYICERSIEFEVEIEKSPNRRIVGSSFLFETIIGMKDIR